MRNAAKLFSTTALLAGIAAGGAWASAWAAESAPDRSAPMQLAQLSAPDLVLRIDQLEAEVRRLTGVVEQLQYRNQQLEQQLRRAQGVAAGGAQPDAQARAREPDAGAAVSGIMMPPPAAAVGLVPGPATGSISSGDPPPPRRDVFDPTQNPNAPGAPRTLGTLSEGAGPPPAGVPSAERSDLGVPGGRSAGAPLDLSSLSDQAVRQPPPAGPALPPGAAGVPNGPSPPPNPSAAGVQTAMAPSAMPRDEYDLAYGYVLHKDYALAEDGFRAFLKKHPGDRLAPDANYWLGEALFQRQHYRDAAESFLAVSTKYETASRAPDALLRLGQSLAALGEKDAACATFHEVGRKYPRASVALKQGAEREQKRAGC